ncbi:MerR family transcriptional regulator [Ramlibacter albus]|uniref:MerR family transcriptional regulator n=1 Tax=Ramlibacter albus TaxID=2079448 RepID=A0A923M5T9_9BURK|nr:MerR family transcriptional regulator [Ramlibacter albus]MBC5763229.1 MerR family transcriptional regulator [Ramlibacter albus]
MLLKVGELARQSGLTVRTLHHYDEIGLLKPSGRSDSRYRLYDAGDIARLHGIQALRQLGLPLADIAKLLDDERAAPAMILQQQIAALEEQIRQAAELRDRLALIREGVEKGQPPGSEDWLQALSLMATYGKYFSTAELRQIFDGWHKIEDDWPKLLAEVRAVMDRGADPQSPEVQKLARRWMALVHHWMDGDMALMQRWGEMYTREPSAHGRRGGPPTDMMHFMQRANEYRFDLLKRHFTMEELSKIRFVPEAEWQAVNDAGARLLAQRLGTQDERVRAVAKQYQGLLMRLVGGDPALLRKMVGLGNNEPLLRSGSPLDPEVRGFLVAAMEGLDPHAT